MVLPIGSSTPARVPKHTQEGLAKDPDFAKLQADMLKFAQLSGRNIAVGFEL